MREDVRDSEIRSSQQRRHLPDRLEQWWQSNTALAAGAVTLIGVCATFLSSTVVSYWNNQLEERKYIASTIISVLKENDAKMAVNKLILLIDTGIIEDHDSKIRDRLLEIRNAPPEQTPQPSPAPRP